MSALSRFRWLSALLFMMSVPITGVRCFAQAPAAEQDLFAAIRQDDVKQVQALLAAGADLNGRDAHSQTPLQAAAVKGSAVLVRLLLERGADVNAASQGRLTALMFAAAGGRLVKTDDRGEREYDSDGFFDILSPEGRSLLNGGGKQNASTEDDPAVLKALLHHGAHVDTRAADGKTALWCAVRTRSRVKVRLLLEAHADPNLSDDQTGSPLRMAVLGKSPEIVRLLLTHRANPNASDRGETPLAAAIHQHQLESADLLLRAGADINRRSSYYNSKTIGTPPLILAIQGRYSEGIRFLLAHHADVNATDEGGGTALLYAIGNRNLPLVKTLLDRGAPLNGLTITDRSRRSKVSLNYLRGVEDPAILEILIARGAKIHAMDEQGENALFAAARNGSPQCVKALLQHGADPNSRNWHGMTALMIAAEYGSIENIHLLLEFGAEVNAQDASQTTALRWALTRKSNLDVLKLLTERGATLNTPDRFGHTPLISAVLEGDVENVQFLLQHGVDRTPRDSAGKTALMWAMELKKIEIVPLLEPVQP